MVLEFGMKSSSGGVLESSSSSDDVGVVPAAAVAAAAAAVAATVPSGTDRVVSGPSPAAPLFTLAARRA